MSLPGCNFWFYSSEGKTCGWEQNVSSKPAPVEEGLLSGAKYTGNVASIEKVGKTKVEQSVWENVSM